MKFWSSRVAALSVFFLAQAACAQSPDVIHTEQSKFENIVVYEQAGERCMKFGSLRSSGRQTCLKVQKPETLLFDYTRMMIGALYLKPDAQRIELVGWAQNHGVSELAIPRKIVHVKDIPVLGTGKTDYVKVEKMALTTKAG